MDRFAITGLMGPPTYDFVVGRWQLARHLDLVPTRLGRSDIPLTCVLADTQAPAYALQLLGRAPSAFPDGRVPLFLCGCGDLNCGTVTVAI
ncbi:MAG: hypothetical protein AAF602_19540, partial [Myxococcota bacterium]